MIHRIVIVLGLLLVVAIVLPAASSAAAGDRYVVVLKEGVSHPGETATDQARRHEADVKFVYRDALNGYAARIPAGELRALRTDRRVAYVERDRRVEVSTTQANATWGLDRIDQRNLPLSGSFSYTATGRGVTAYIIDTGIRFSHSEFGGRATSGYDAVDGGAADDCNGHGTHVAGTAGGSTYGVAKEVGLVGIRVLNCGGSGYTSGVIAGIDWATADHDPGEPAVANMSLGGGASSALDSAVRNSIVDGVGYAVAAGNGNAAGRALDACKRSPARVGEAMTISATDKNDRKASWANHGGCVDWFAPGVSITSAWHTGDGAANTISGTSMATPHTAGVAALYLEGSPGASPQTVRQAIYALTTKSKVSSSKTANNHLLFTGF